jgi:hypothetical protein
MGKGKLSTQNLFGSPNKKKKPNTEEEDGLFSMK